MIPMPVPKLGLATDQRVSQPLTSVSKAQIIKQLIRQPIRLIAMTIKQVTPTGLPIRQSTTNTSVGYTNGYQAGQTQYGKDKTQGTTDGQAVGAAGDPTLI